MIVSWLYLIVILVASIKELINGRGISVFSIKTILLWIVIILANGIISICSRLDDLKRK